jgi:hypothetical protein
MLSEFVHQLIVICTLRKVLKKLPMGLQPNTKGGPNAMHRRH